MKNKGIFSFLALNWALALAFLSCGDAGLGEKVDLEAPVIAITSHTNMNYIGYDAVISGTCSDNKEVTEVLLSYTIDGASYSQKATLSEDGLSWSCSLHFDQNAEIQLSAQAYDKSKNESENSVAYLTLIVDSEDPDVKSFFLRRNNSIPISLSEISDLEEVVKGENSSSNKYKLQNEKITLVSEIKDNYRLATAKVTIVDENNDAILSDISYDQATSPYSAEFTVTHDALVAANSALEKGVHYLKPVLTVEDAARNSCVFSKGYFVWYPESDLPKIELGETEGKIVTAKNSQFHPVFFDDDGLEEIYSGLIEKEIWEAALSENDDSIAAAFESLKDSAFTKTTLSGTSDYAPTIEGPSDSGAFYFVCAAKDKKDDSSTGVFAYKSCPVTVTSDDDPVLFLSSPEENTTPSLTDGKSFTVQAYALDNKALSDIAIAWIPGSSLSSAQIEEAENLISKKFSSITEGGSYTDSASGSRIYRLSVEGTSEAVVNKKSYKKMTFSKTFDITKDFYVNGSLENTTKTFVLYAKDSDSNETFKTFRLGSYTDLPEISLTYWTDLDSTKKNFDDITNAGNKLSTFYTEISVSGTKGISVSSTSASLKTSAGDTSELEIKNGQIVIENVKVDYTYTLTVKARDIFGNENTLTKTVKTAAIPQLEKIYSEMKNGIILSEGDTLTLFAQFATSVKITGSPKILLTNIQGLAANQYAQYVSGSGGDTLKFTYTVPANAYTADGEKVSSDSKITLNGAGITCDGSALSEENLSLKDSEEVLAKDSVIYIDAVLPTVAAFSPEKNSYSLESGSTEISLEFSEAVYKESGNITIRRKSSADKPWAIPIVLTSDEFSSLYSEMEDWAKLAMIGTSTGESSLSDTTGMALGPYVKTTHGIILADDETAGGIVSDTSTKYLLQFDLDPHAADGTVGQLRSALESINYHQTVIDVTSSDVSLSADNKTLTITVPSSLFVDGREYEVLLDSGILQDSAGNLFGGIEAGEFTFWTNKTATPVIRVERYSHGWGAKEANADGSVNAALENEDVTTRPTGYVRVRIDSETNDASIKYGFDTRSPDETTVSDLLAATTHNNGESYCPAAYTLAEYQALETKSDYSDIFVLGDPSLYQAHRYYIKAVAAAANLSDSDAGYEGAYKTVIFYKDPRCGSVTSGQNEVTAKALKIQGKDREDGISIMAGFPLRDATPDERYQKYAYQIIKDDCDGTHMPSDYVVTNDDHVLISYDFVSSWYIQTVRTNWQNNSEAAPGAPSYGCFYYTYDRTYWDARN